MVGPDLPGTCLKHGKNTEKKHVSNIKYDIGKSCTIGPHEFNPRKSWVAKKLSHTPHSPSLCLARPTQLSDLPIREPCTVHLHHGPQGH